MKLPCESSTHLTTTVPATNATQMMLVWRKSTAAAPLYEPNTQTHVRVSDIVTQDPDTHESESERTSALRT